MGAGYNSINRVLGLGRHTLSSLHLHYGNILSSGLLAWLATILVEVEVSQTYIASEFYLIFNYSRRFIMAL